MFELVEEPPDEVALSVKRGIDGSLHLAVALGIDPEGDLPICWQGWTSDLGLTEAQTIETARATRQNHPAPPDGPKALDRAMEREAQLARSGELAAVDTNIVNSDGFLPANTIRDAMLARGPVTPERLKARGIRRALALRYCRSGH